MSVVQKPTCHGEWGDGGQQLSCSLRDLLFDTNYAAQIFDWQNAVFLCFFPLMLGIATLVLRLTYGSSGEATLKDIMDKAGDMHKTFADWGSSANLAQQVSGGNMGTEDEVGGDIESSSDPAPPHVEDPMEIEMGQSSSDQMELHTSSHPTDIDPRNLSVMITLSAFIISIGMIGWAAISEFVDINSNDFSTKGIYAQGFWTQGTKQGAEQRGINIGWGLCWLCIGSVLMTIAQLIIRKVVMGPAGMNVVEAVLEKGNVAAAICEAGMQISMGMVVAATISGPPSNSFGEDLGAAILFFVLALLMLLLWSFVFDKITFAWATWEEIGRGNVAAAISQFSQYVCTGLLLSNSIYKSFELSTFFGWFLSGTLIRMAFRVVLDFCLIAPRCINRRYSQKDLFIDNLIAKGNWGAAVVVGALQYILTHVINNFLPDSCWSFVYSDGRDAGTMTLAERLAGTEYVVVMWKWDRLVAIVIIFFVLVLARVPYELRLVWRAHMARVRGEPPLESNLNYYIVEGNKHAVTISFGAYLVASGHMLVGVFRDANYFVSFVDSNDPNSWGFLFLQIVVGYIMIVVALIISDVAILHKFDNIGLMMRDDNRAVALIEAGSLIGSSFCVAAVINGWDTSEPPYGSAIIFFFATQILFFIFQLTFESITKYDDEKEVELGNAAAGLNNALNLVAIGMLLGRSAYLSHSLVMLVCWALITYPLIFFFRFVTDWIVLPSIHLEATIECLDRLRPDVYAPRRVNKQGNWGTALVAGSVTISLAQLLNTFLRDCPFALGIPSPAGVDAG